MRRLMWIALSLLLVAGPVCVHKGEEENGLLPPVIIGPAYWYTNTPLMLRLTGGRVENGRISYLFMVDTLVSESWTAYFPDAETIGQYVYFITTGVHSVRARVRDTKGRISDWSPPYQVTILQCPPLRPESLYGPDSGVAGYEYTFQTRVWDPDTDSVAVRFDWGDGTISSWSGYQPSGSLFSMRHAYQDTGIYLIRVQARDVHGDTSSWSDSTLRIDVCKWLVTVLNEGFEQGFPGPGWRVRGDPTWDTTGYRQQAGRFSIWCAGSAREPAQGYAPRMYASAIYGPFSLADADSAYVEFWHWTDSEHPNDLLYWFVMVDTVRYYICDITGGRFRTWQRVEIDLTNVPGLGNACGREQLWIGWAFNSNYEIEYEGVYLDGVVIRKRLSRQE